jgi:hypothetical protein
MPTPRTLNGELTAGEQVLYRAPADRWAVLVSLRMLNKSGSTATGSVFVRTRAGSTQIAGQSLGAVGTATNGYDLGSVRMVLEPDTSILAIATAAAAIDCTLTLLEYPLSV